MAADKGHPEQNAITSTRDSPLDWQLTVTWEVWEWSVKGKPKKELFSTLTLFFAQKTEEGEESGFVLKPEAKQVYKFWLAESISLTLFMDTWASLETSR